MHSQKAKLEKAAKLKALSDKNSETQGASSIEKADVIELEYSQTQSQLTSPNERKRKLNAASSQRPNDVLRAPSPARGKAVHGEWCVVWSEVMRRLFFYNMQTEVGQIDVPSELEPIYGQDGAEGPAIDTLRANMAAQDNRVVDMSDAQRGEFGRTSTRTQNWPDEECTLRDSQAEGDDDGAEVCGGEGEGAASGDEEETMDGLNLTGEDFAEDVTQCPGIVPSSPPPAAPTQTQVGTSQKQVLIVDDSPYNSMDESQSSVDPLLKRSAGGRVSSSFDIATAVMHKMEAAMMQNGEDGDPPGEDAPNECEDVIVPCPQCTFHNAPGASECEICLTKLLVVSIYFKLYSSHFFLKYLQYICRAAKQGIVVSLFLCHRNRLQRHRNSKMGKNHPHHLHRDLLKEPGRDSWQFSLDLICNKLMSTL